MNILKTLAAFLLGLLALFAAQRFLNVPPIPVISVFICALLFGSGASALRALTTALTALAGAGLYGLSCYLTVVHYPAYGNWLAAASDGLTALLSLGAGVLLVPSLIRSRKS